MFFVHLESTIQEEEVEEEELAAPNKKGMSKLS